QVEMADILILNKADLISKKQCEHVESKIKAINRNALIVKSERANFHTGILFGLGIEHMTSKSQVHEHYELAEIQSVVFETSKKIHKVKFENFLTNLESVYRAKGFINFENGSFIFNYVLGRYEFEKLKHEKTLLVFIGKNLKKEEILNKLKECEI
ncbi:MAG: GTP-binding protein, partial [Nanoarchaeota archaeon]